MGWDHGLLMDGVCRGVVCCLLSVDVDVHVDVDVDDRRAELKGREGSRESSEKGQNIWVGSSLKKLGRRDASLVRF
jgi:hypothetical protein